MINLIYRHGHTDYSVQHRVNGDPSFPVLLSRVGWQTCRRAQASMPSANVRTWISSEFPRARQTTMVLMGSSSTEPVVEPRLNELDYGVFEGTPFLSYGGWLTQRGPDQRPEGAAESQRQGIVRMLSGLSAVLNHPGDRVIVGHGLLTSVLTWAVNAPRHETLPLFLPEAPYVEPLVLSDDELTDLLAMLADRIAPSDVAQ
ncbi:histidine phosphatase family protein [Kribbella sp. NPDC056951]|uniref:histidine phosphatase family protein n=1 Tax=Kribbella sp. NPDC056951 TaxID=3345978 RepID=UPI00363EF739